MRSEAPMRICARSALTGLAVAIAFGLLAAGAHAAGSLGLAEWEAGTCKGSEAEVREKVNCSYASDPSKFYTQAAGHPPWGLTGFKLSQSGEEPSGGAVKRIRVDVPPGLAADPQAPGTCERSTFESNSKLCPADSKAGFVELKAFLQLPVLGGKIQELKGQVYNLPLEAGKPLLFGIDVEGVPPLVEDVHLFLVGHVSFAQEGSLLARGIPSGDYHEWFEIDNVPPEVAVKVLALPVAKAPLKTLESKLFFDGHAGKGGNENFLTLPSECGPPSKSTSYLELETYPPVEKLSAPTVPPVGVSGCDKVPFKPSTSVTPETATYDQPDGTTTVVKVPQNVGASQINTADIDDAHVTLPEGLTLNPPAAHELQACTPAQIGIGTAAPVSCPAASRIGTVTIETDLPPGSLAGPVFLGGPPSGLITDPPFTIYIDAESMFGVSVRLQGSVSPNPVTGRLEVSFLHNPQLPFSELRLTLNGGDHAPLANPLTCTPQSTDFLFTPYTGGAPALGSSPFSASGCPASIPFGLAQSTATSAPNAGAYTSYTFNLARGDGNQYLGKVSTTLPAGLVGEIPRVPLCGEPQAQAGTCAAASQIGTATAAVGSGGDPYSFTGPVFLTGPYAGAPYGLSIPIRAAAGPFDLGNVVTHVAITVDPHSGRVVATSTDLPTIFKGVPLRLRSITVVVNRKPFLFNPSNCGALSTDSLLSSTLGATQRLSSPFAVTNCGALPFKPNFSAATSASTNPTQLKANGASLRVNLLQGAHEANIRSVVAELPKALPSRLTTLQKACLAATYEANPFSCPAGSKVGTATVSTPVLPAPLSGPAYLVSHGGEAFPDLDLLLEGDGGVRVILESHTDIKNGITKSTFPAIPDVPASSFVLDLPQGPNSALTAVGTLCTQTLTMPTTITAQSGAVVKQSTNIAVAGCTGHGKGRTRIRILSKKIKHHRLVLRVQIFAPGRVSVTNRNLKAKFRKFSKAGRYTIKVRLSHRGAKAQAAHRLKFKFRVGFLPKSKAESVSIVFAKIGFAKKRRHGGRSRR
jgi:hypothetical protein